MKFVKAHYASIGLIVLGIGQLLTGKTRWQEPFLCRKQRCKLGRVRQLGPVVR